MKSWIVVVAMGLMWVWLAAPAAGHHVLGINQADKATESPQIPGAHEIQVEDYLIAVTVLPERPLPGDPARVIVYTKHAGSGSPYMGEMAFRIVEQGWFAEGSPVTESTQRPIEDRHIQSVTFPAEGAYRVQLGFTQAGHAYAADVSVEVGTPGGGWNYVLVAVLLAGAGWVVWRARRNRRRLRPV